SYHNAGNTSSSSNSNSQQSSTPAASAPAAAPAYSSGDTGDFQELPDDDDLPF
ncbi:MAG TPA: single-stranded DNA-binding protein, partial [Ruminococcaceae bacterium]|nr:single-stranded DNA-binding protein [Oscillospiraceae bacterium]